MDIDSNWIKTAYICMKWNDTDMRRRRWRLRLHTVLPEPGTWVFSRVLMAVWCRWTLTLQVSGQRRPETEQRSRLQLMGSLCFHWLRQKILKVARTWSGMQSKHLKMKRLATGSQTFFWWSLTPFWSLGQNLILLVITASITSSRRVSQRVHVGVTVYTRGSPSSFICINTPWFSLTNCSLWIILTRLCVCTGFTVLSKQDQVARGHSWLKTRKGKETHIKHTFLRQLGLFYELLNGAHGWRMCSTSYLVRSS